MDDRQGAGGLPSRGMPEEKAKLLLPVAVDGRAMVN
jgi:hypothetical protein